MQLPHKRVSPSLSGSPNSSIRRLSVELVTLWSSVILFWLPPTLLQWIQIQYRLDEMCHDLKKKKKKINSRGKNKKATFFLLYNAWSDQDDVEIELNMDFIEWFWCSITKNFTYVSFSINSNAMNFTAVFYEIISRREMWHVLNNTSWVPDICTLCKERIIIINPYQK